MQTHGVKQIVLSSTCATYGVPDVVPISETHPQKPINPYGSSKISNLNRIIGTAWNWMTERQAVRRTA